MNRPKNKTIIQKYLDHYNHSPQSRKMRESNLRFFFGEYFPLGNGTKSKTWFNYDGHIFDIDNEKIIDYFDYLKTLDTVSITTRKNRWHIFISFLNYTMYIYRKYNFIIAKPPKEFVSFENAVSKKTKVKSNRKIFATKEEIQKILDYLNAHNFKHYLIFRIFVETGMRKGELINAKYTELEPEERFINPEKGKKDEKYYFFTESLAKLLKIYLQERKSLKIQKNFLFLTNGFEKYSNRAFNLILKGNISKGKNGELIEHIGVLDAIGIDKVQRNITCHTFRRTINDFRKDMGCPNEDRKILLGHKIRDVNVRSYTNSDYKRLRILFDKWNPYKDLKL
ncbi:MAG: tyrosine-type recombinase/integrase [Candidatus Thorarchaeota archaeon]